MTTDAALRPAPTLVGIGRAGSGIVVVAVLAYGYCLRIAVGDSNFFDYFGYFTNQTSLLASIVLILTGLGMLCDGRIPPALTLLRGMVTAYLVVVALIYNLLVPGTGSAPPWMSALLHVVFPCLVLGDWLLIGDRPRLPWRRLWLLVPYPLLWLSVVLIRGATDGWVPYGFLLPERGWVSLTVTIAGLLAAIIASGALVWTASRGRGVVSAQRPDPNQIPLSG